MFMSYYSIFHSRDCCTRWHAAFMTPSKDDQTLLDALDTIRVIIHGPMGDLRMNGEAGLVASHSAKQHYERFGIKFMPRAKEQQEFKQVLNDCTSCRTFCCL